MAMAGSNTPKATGTSGSRGLYGFDARVAHPARVYDYWLGGKDNFEADRIAGEETIAAYPAIRASARANRAFLARSVRYLAAEAGVRQFLDIGTGLPTASNTHEVAQGIAPSSRVVYVDNDPLVLSHARALLASRPVAVMMLGVLIYVSDTAEAYRIVNRLMHVLPSGSYLAVAHSTSEVRGE